MSEDFTQLDELIESDIREALGESISKEIPPDEVMNVPEELLDNIIEPEVSDIEQDTQSDGEVLDDIGDIEILPMAEIESALEDEEDEILDSSITNVNTSDLAKLLSQLLNNKTIEITIKVKD